MDGVIVPFEKGPNLIDSEKQTEDIRRCMTNLEHILTNVPDVRIVMSTAWRNWYDEDFFEKVFGWYLHVDWRTRTDLTTQDVREISGYEGDPNLTMILLDSGWPWRGSEIQEWLNRHPEVENYVIIDDHSDMLQSQMDNFVQTESHLGLTKDHADTIISMFNGEEEVGN